MKAAGAGADTFRTLLRQGEDQLWLSFEKARASFSHPGLVGDVREDGLRSFLEAQLPSRFRVVSGQVMDSRGIRSGQTDIVIFDGSNTAPLVDLGDGKMLLAAESVLATIEVKSKLNGQELERALIGVHKLHSLQPWGKTWSPSRMRGGADDGRPRLFTNVFAYESSLEKRPWPRNELSRLNLKAVQVGLPIDRLDRLVILDRGLVLPREARVAEPSGERRVLGLWFFNLMNFLAREVERRNAFPWSDYEIDDDQNWRSYQS